MAQAQRGAEHLLGTLHYDLDVPQAQCDVLQQLVLCVRWQHVLDVLSHVDVVHGLRQRRGHAQIGVDTCTYWPQDSLFKYCLSDKHC